MNPIVMYNWAQPRGRFILGRSWTYSGAVSFPASSKAEAFQACNEKIGDNTIRGPWRFEFEASTP